MIKGIILTHPYTKIYTDHILISEMFREQKNINMLIIEDLTVTAKVKTDNVTNNSKGRGTHSFIFNRQMI